MLVYGWVQYMDLLCVTRNIPKLVTFGLRRTVTYGVSGAVEMIHSIHCHYFVFHTYSLSPLCLLFISNKR